MKNPRLLPWAGPDGKPCYLIGDGTGRLAQLADQVEAVQLGLARQTLERARTLLDGPPPGAGELRLLAGQLGDALRDALLIAECRARSGAPDD
ncbi:hypothetical protein ACFW2Y_21490 [Streptomyces sp. NPDC058877]|uniref:hypothetical protein n=1 Tax=unclassified Streptomyces TaxID=2593676 RepID=UPI0036BFD2C4